MKTWSPEFSRALHRAARREIFTSPEWKRAYWRTYLTDLACWGCLVFLASAAIALPLLMSYGKPQTVAGQPEREFQWAFNWYATELLMLCGLALWNTLGNRHGTALQGWQRLPLVPKAAFALGVRDFVVGWLVFGSLIGCYFLTLLNLHWTGEWRPDLAAVGGLAYGFSIVVCGYPLAWLVSLPRPQTKTKSSQPNAALGMTVGMGALALLMGCFVGPGFVAYRAKEWGIAGWFGPLSESLPGAWTGRLVFESLAQGRLTLGDHWLPLGVMLALVPLWHQLLRRRFCALAPDHFAPVLAEPPAMPEAEANPLQAVREAMTEPARWMRGGVAERLVGLWLRPAEHRLAALIFAGTPSWGKGLRNLHLLVVVALVAGWWLLRERSRLSLLAAVCCFGVAVLFLLANSMFSSSFGASLGDSVGTIRTPGLPLLLPVDARAYAWVWLKVIALRSLLALPLYILTGLVLEAVFWRFMRPFTGYMIALWLFAVVLAPLGPTMRLIGQADVTRWRQAWQWPLSLVLLFLTTAAPVMGVVLTVKFGLAWALTAQGIIAVILLALLVGVTRAYERGRIDLRTAQPRLLTNQPPGQPPVGMRITIG